MTQVLAHFILRYRVISKNCGYAKAEKKRALRALLDNGGAWMEKLYKHKNKDSKAKTANVV